MRDDFLDRINKKYGEHKKESISEYLDQFLNAQKNIVKNNEDEKARRQRGEAYDHLQSKMSDDELVKMDKLSRKQKELVKTEMKLEITTEDFEIQIVQNLK
jgi:flagellar hook-associated protein FlgK